MRLRSEVRSAEIVPRHQRVHEQLVSLARRLEEARSAIWTDVETTQLLGETQLAEERQRELPR